MRMVFNLLPSNGFHPSHGDLTRLKAREMIP